MSTATTTIGVSADWMSLLASMQEDLEAVLKNAEPLCAMRRHAVALLRASNDGMVVGTRVQDDNVAFLESLLRIEHLVREIDRILATA